MFYRRIALPSFFINFFWQKRIGKLEGGYDCGRWARCENEALAGYDCGRVGGQVRRRTQDAALAQVSNLSTIYYLYYMFILCVLSTQDAGRMTGFGHCASVGERAGRAGPVWAGPDLSGRSGVPATGQTAFHFFFPFRLRRNRAPGMSGPRRRAKGRFVR